MGKAFYLKQVHFPVGECPPGELPGAGRLDVRAKARREGVDDAPHDGSAPVDVQFDDVLAGEGARGGEVGDEGVDVQEVAGGRVVEVANVQVVRLVRTRRCSCSCSSG